MVESTKLAARVDDGKKPNEKGAKKKEKDEKSDMVSYSLLCCYFLFRLKKIASCKKI